MELCFGGLMDEEYNQWLDQQYYYEFAGSFECADINNNEK
jgi:hypothetical protein